MKFYLGFSILALALAFTLLSIACSNSRSPAEPAIENISGISNDIPESINTETSNRTLFAVYDAVIDPTAKTFTITPVVRNSQYHFPLTQLYPNVLTITGFGFSPNFWADIKLAHPLPGSGIDGFDPRVIAILPANTGVRFIYPTLAVGGNNAVVLEPDGYTKLFDNLGGTIAGNVNPFKAYFKSQPNRRWASVGTTMETQRWQMDIAGFGGPLRFKLVVDVSSNYPSPPTPGTDNAPEPVRIDATVGTGLTPSGGSAGITVTLLDWQGQSGIGGVLVEAPSLFNGTVNLAYSAPGPNPNEYIYTGTITNSLLAPAGQYKLLISVWDQATGIYAYSEFSTSVGDIPTGNLIWAKQAGGTDYNPDAGNAITTLSDNSTVVTGCFYGITAIFGPGESNQTTMTSEGYNDIFIARYNTNGTLSWAKRAGGGSYDWGYGITALSDDSTVVTGAFYYTVTFGLDESNETILTSIGNDKDIFIARYDSNGTLMWAKRAGGANDDRGWDITALADNSVIVSGLFWDTATFGQGEPNETSLTSTAYMDICLAKYNPDGTLAWAKSAGGASFDYCMGISANSDNSTVITGYFYNSTTFGLGEPNETTLTTPTSFEDIFIARYNPDGTLAWAKRAGGSNGELGSAIAALSDNSSVVTGGFYGPATFGPGEPNQTVLTPAGEDDMFIARYNPDGTLEWAKRAGGPNSDSSWGITVLSDNSTVVTGRYVNSATFGPGEPNQTILSSIGIFTARYNPDGTLAWAKSSGGMSNDWGYGITALSDNSTVVTGMFYGAGTFGAGEANQTILNSSAEGTDIFVARFNP